LARGSLISGQPYVITCVIRSGYYRARMDRLRPLSESDCYTRLYGQRDPTVTIVSRSARSAPWPSMTGDDIRDAFDDRLDAREPGVEAEAA
jgi:hypothetical protein